MKHIAMISYHTCPLASQEGKETGGMNVYVLELGKELARQGHRVDVFTRAQDTDSNEIVEVEKNFRVIHLVAGPKGSVPKKSLVTYIPDFVTRYREFCTKEGISYDIIHAHYYQSGLVVSQLMALGERTPFVMSFHTLALMKNLVARDEAEKESKERIDAEVMLTGVAKKIIAPSQSDKEYLQYLYNTHPEKIAVIPPGVNTALFSPRDMTEAKKHINVAKDNRVILFVGRIEPVKGIDVLLYATKIVVQRNPDIPVCVCIVGGDISQKPSGWSKTLQSLEELRKTLQLTTSVTFLGQQTQPELPYYYNAADMVVMPSHYESFGMTALEAMACGVPVITTNVTGVSTLIDETHTSLITSVNNPLLLASQMEHLLQHPEERARIGSEVRQKVLDLSWETIAKHVDTLYDEVI